MNFSERRNYTIAVLVSLACHCLLLLFYLPGFLAAKTPGWETYPVGLVEIAPSSPDTANGTMISLNQPISQQPPKNPEAKQGPEKTVNFKPVVNSTSPPQKTIVLPKKEGIAITGNPGKEPVPKGNSGETGGVGNSGVGKSQGFGTGEGMVTVRGPMSPYPKNAMNEGKEGDVALRILVKADGSLEQVTVTNSSGDLRLDKAARGTIERTWKFKPVSQDYYIDLVFSFNMQSGVSLKFLNSATRP